MSSEWNNKVIGANLLFAGAGYVAALAFNFQKVASMAFNPIFASLGLAAFDLGMAILAKLLYVIFRPETSDLDELSRACWLSLGIQILITFPLYMLYIHLVQ